MPKQVEQYENERKILLNKMFEILGINESNNTFSLHKIDNNIDLQNEILNLESEIKKVFICGEWSFFKKKIGVKRRWLSLIKCLIKAMGYKTFISEKNTKINNKLDRDKIYFIIKI